MNSTGEFAVGMLVRVPWGLDHLEGQVEAVYGSGDTAKLAVSLHVPESDETETLTLPARLVQHVDPSRREDSVGHWLEAYKFWEALAATVGRLLAETNVSVNSELHLASDKSDIVVRRPDGTILLIEAKATRHVDSSSLRAMLDQIDHYAKSQAGPVRSLLVTQAEIPFELRDAVAKFSRDDVPIEVVTWRGHEDDPALQAALNRSAT